MGTFGAAIGLKGEIKINLLTSSVDIFKSLDHYYNHDQSIEWKFDFIQMRHQKCVGLPSHCKNRDDAEHLKNQKIFVDKEKVGDAVFQNPEAEEGLFDKAEKLFGLEEGTIH